ncbi:hypothetical protein JF50_13190 [Pseudoalteromonas luteoviolacea]|uniref:Uncharacterized protein n=1 Tax=Pseudoalteromonas luteoviolacea TaxID=43657 RepID=A0A0C1QP68_9GAMM|nr:hypothetical protein [Pseudoalteromonas luteoviolacea]KID56847.1 hypothetical protein JF50_13190 [Pseudoalteromonas luteoviolacea]
MASLEEAYSTEYQEIIDPELAYDLYWAGIITDKSAFECPGDKCDAKVTCINLDQEKQDMRQSPHFRGYNHSDSCDATFGQDRPPGEESPQTPAQSKFVKSDVISDIFHLKRPKNQFAKKDPKGIDPTKEKKKSRRRGRNITGDELYGGSKYYSVRSLVSKFIRYRKNDSLTEYNVNINGKDVSYKSLFKGVYQQPLEALPDENLIYWGVAFIDYLDKQKCYKISFVQTLEHNGDNLRPSFFVSENMIADYPVKNLVVKRLNKLSKEKDKRAFIFIYSKPRFAGGKYINFQLDSLDYLEIRYLDLFEELVKKT